MTAAAVQIQLCVRPNVYVDKLKLVNEKWQGLCVNEMEHVVPELGVAGEFAWLACADTLAASTAVLTA